MRYLVAGKPMDDPEPTTTIRVDLSEDQFVTFLAWAPAGSNVLARLKAILEGPGGARAHDFSFSGTQDELSELLELAAVRIPQLVGRIKEALEPSQSQPQ